MFKRQKYSDQQVVEAIKQGDRAEDQVISYLIEKNQGRINQLILSRSGSQEDAEDILQEALTALLFNVKRGSFKGESSVHTYLYAICKGMWYKRFKKYMREKDYQSTMIVDDRDEDTPEIDLLDEEQRSLIEQMFDQLRAKCKEVLYFWGQGYAMSEIAEKLDFSGSQVAMNKKNKCLKELRGLMDHDPLVQQLVGELRK
ncbi:MAG: sigma-70 family RNA polymerase sigma factor [Cyclobacteriaceae bacterium]|nr:sigma-70 family RNA polymerase sigma factor [Cyclobacteriaceae bacterium]